jgi:hypothetical protein
MGKYVNKLNSRTWESTDVGGNREGTKLVLHSLKAANNLGV